MAQRLSTPKRGRFVFLALSFSIGVCQAKGDWYLATRSANSPLQWLDTGAKQPITETPLGSTWKLMVYAYAIDNNLPDKPYACRIGQNAAKDDEYCCTKTETISREVALARSCGPYFDPKRLEISAPDWQRYWQRVAPQTEWVHDLSSMQANTMVSVENLLATMNAIPKTTVQRSREALLQRVLQPQWAEVLARLGSGYRFKTYTWHLPNQPRSYWGGAVGWLADGRSFWLGGTGGSRAVLQAHASQITQLLPPATAGLQEGCVNVNYFARYPIAKVTALGSAAATEAGALSGAYVVHFANGTQLPIHANGELSLEKQGKKWKIAGHLGLQEYVARVLDREGKASKVQAARALTVAIRSYLQQNGVFHQACWQIDDDSRYQRVSPNPASAAARTIAAFTEGLALTGSPIYYHQNKSNANTLNWQEAAAQSGQSFSSLLRHAYPNASWQLSTQEQQCQVLTAAQNYVNGQLPQVKQFLQGTTGLENVDNLQICRLDYGNPFTDPDSHRIFLRDWRGVQDKMTVWHEYLHLALRYHPSGQDEGEVERLAQLVMTQISPVVTAVQTRKIRRAQ